MDPRRGWFRAGWAAGERPAELEMHLTGHLRGLVCQTGLTWGRKGNLKWRPGVSHSRGLDGGVPLLLGTPHWQRPKLSLSLQEGVSSDPRGAPPPPSERLFGLSGSSPCPPAAPQPHFCALLQSLGRVWVGAEVTGKESGGQSAVPPPLDASKTESAPRKPPTALKPPDWGGRGGGGGTGKGLEEGLCKAAARNLGSQSGFCQEAPGREAPGQHLGAAADKLCDPDPREPTAGLCSHLSKPRAGPPPRPITH